MYVQVISGRVQDAAAIEERGRMWGEQLRPGAAGFLGSTGGVAPDGRTVLLARFESEDAARRNSDREEQGSWWAETEKLFVEGPDFVESTDVDELRGGGSDDAGFVQIMRGSAPRDLVHELDQLFESVGDGFRPDLLGMVRVWTGPESYVEAAYFTSEADARAGESEPMPPEVQEQMGKYEAMMSNIEFLDLPNPMLTPGA